MVYSVRMQCGKVLAKETYVEADLVSSVPESGTAAAHGYALEVCLFFTIVKFNLLKTNFLVWYSFRRSIVQKSIRGPNFHPAKHQTETAWSGQEIWSPL